MGNRQPEIKNRQVFRDFHVEKKYEAGIQLFGNEVKSLRAAEANLKGSFAKIEGNEIFLYNMHISPYDFTRENQDPVRPRKLLLNRSEIKQIIVKNLQQGYTLVPIRVYFRRGFAKVEIGLAKGKKLHDKRQDLKKKQVQRETDREIRGRR